MKVGESRSVGVSVGIRVGGGGRRVGIRVGESRSEYKWVGA